MYFQLFRKSSDLPNLFINLLFNQLLGAEEIVIIKSPEYDDETSETPVANKIPETSPPIANIIDELENLSSDEKFDIIFISTLLDYDKEKFYKFLKPETGVIVSTVEQNVSSDNFNLFIKLFYSVYVRLKRSLFTLLNINLDWNGPHLCHNSLDRLGGYVNDGVLQTVVDLVIIIYILCIRICNEF